MGKPQGKHEESERAIVPPKPPVFPPKEPSPSAGGDKKPDQPNEPESK